MGDRSYAVEVRMVNWTRKKTWSLLLFPLYCYSHRVSDIHIKVASHGELNYMKEEVNNQR